MKKSTEIRKELETLRNTMEGLTNAGKKDEAYAMLGQLNELKNELQMAEALEGALPAPAPTPSPKAAVNETAVFNKTMLGRPLSPAEQDYVNVAGTPGQVETTDGKGGYIVPEEQFKELLEEKRKRVSLKAYCNVQPVTSNKGSIPKVIDDKNGMLIKFDELTEIGKSDFDFGQIKFETADYGDIIPVSNSLLQDTNINLTSVIKKRLAIKGTKTENAEIVKLLVASKKVAGKDWKDINKVLNVELDPAISANAIIVTNQTSFDWLDTLVDGTGKPLLTPDLTNPAILRYRGRKVVVVPDNVIVPSGKLDFYIGDLEEAITFFDRKMLALAVSTEAGFTANATLLRAIERFDVKPVDLDAMRHLEITVAGK